MFNWNMFPFTKMNAINLDWLMKKFQELVDKTGQVDQAVLDAQAAAEAAEEAAQSITGAVLYDRVQTLTNPEQAQARDNIGAAYADDVVTDVVQYNTVQILSTAQKEQARDNIGAADAADTVGVLRYTEQTLTAAQQAQARDNIGAADADDIISDPVQYDTVQTLTAAQQAQARANIGAADADDIISDPVQYDTVQTLSSAQQAQARANIGAAAEGSVAPAVAHAIMSVTTDANGWTKIAYADGRAEAFKRVTVSTTITNAWGSMFMSDSFTLGNYPTGFFDMNESLFYDFSLDTASNGLAFLGVVNTDTSSLGNATLFRGTSSSNERVYNVDIRVTGKLLS